MGFLNRWKVGDKDDSSELSFDYQDLLAEINPCGKFQLRMTFLFWLSTGAAGIAVVAFAFTAFTPAYRCAIKACEDPASANYYQFPENETFPDYVLRAYGNASLVKAAAKSCQTFPFEPLEKAPSVLDVGTSETCESFLQRLENDTTGGNDDLVSCSHEDLIYHDDPVHSSLIQKYGFTCGKSILFNIFNAFYMLGMLIGSFLMGVLSDKFGRMKTLALSIILISVPSTLSAFSPWSWLFGLLRFLTGIGGIGCFMVPYVYILENTAPRHVVGLTTAVGIGFPVGELVLGIYAFLIRDWFPLHMVAYTPLLLGLSLLILLPESVRWLVSNGRLAEAKVALQEIAKVNGKELPDYKFRQNTTQMGIIDAKSGGGGPKPNILDLFRPKEIAFRSINMFFQWYSVTMAYYGITFALTTLSPSPYINFMLGVVTEIPGALFGYFFTDYLGRKFILSFLQTLSGISCILAGLLVSSPSLKILQTCLALLGKFGATCAFSTVYLYTSELFPTSIRGTAVGLCSTIARIGGVCSLLLAGLSRVWEPFPMVIMGSVATLAGICALFFPETTGVGLPETMEDAINISKNNNFKLCQKKA